MNRKQSQRMVKRKKVIDILRSKTIRHKDLVKETRIPEKTVDRILAELEFLGLARKREDGYWAWYENIRSFNSVDEYDRAMEHSNKLVLSLGSLLLEDMDPKMRFPNYIVQREELKLGLTVGEALQQKQFVEEHLKTGYPSIYDELIECRRLRSKLRELGKGRMEEFLRMYEDKTGRFMMVRYKRIREGSWFRKIFPKTTVELEEYPEGTLWGPFTVGSEEEKRFMELMESIPEEIQNAYFRIEEKMEKAYEELAGDIQLLLMKIHNGTPLEGSCQLCPRIEMPSD